MKIRLFVILVFILFINVKLFAETEEEKYRVNNIHPVQASGGITTGGVIAYGHYIKPPYQVTMEVKDIIVNYDEDMNPERQAQYYIYINGICIAPKLSLEELKSGKITYGLPEINKEKANKKRKRTKVITDLENMFYEESSINGDDVALKKIENYAKQKADVINKYSFNDKINKIEMVLDDGQIFNISSDDLRRIGRNNIIKSFVRHIRSCFCEWEIQKGQSAAVDLLYQEFKKYPIIEEYKLFEPTTRTIEIKYKGQFDWEKILFYINIPSKGKNPISASEAGTSWVNNYKRNLEGDGIILIYPKGESGMDKNTLIKIVEILKRNDLDKSSKIQAILKNKDMDEELVKMLIYNYNASEYLY